MTTDPFCEAIQAEISAAHDGRRALSAEASTHLGSCAECTSFAVGVDRLEGLLAVGRFDHGPDLQQGVARQLEALRSRWWGVAAVALVGLTVGGILGALGSRVDIGLATDLHDLLYTSGSAIEGLSADLVVVERGVHPDVPERVYSGSIDYVAPEGLAIELVDTTRYPSDGWIHNDTRIVIDGGLVAITASTRCPVPALPGCLTAPSSSAIQNLSPFVDGTLRPLELVGPGRSLGVPSDIDIVGTPVLEGRDTVQVRTSVAGAELLSAITERGSWRELHPTDPVLMWLDRETLVPVRVEAFAADSPERELWQIRRGYTDDLGGREPILIVSLEGMTTRPGTVEHDLIDDARDGGFRDGIADLPEFTLPVGFVEHREGSWFLPDGGEVHVGSWSDGRSWLKIEATTEWDEPHLFGLASPFVEAVQLPLGVGYLAPSGDRLSLHGPATDLVVSGSVPRSVLLEFAASIEVDSAAVPDDWPESSVVRVDEFPDDVLVPDVTGWSVLGRFEPERPATILLTGAGERSVMIIQRPGSDLELPVGPDVVVVDVAGEGGRYDSATGTLAWVQDDLRVEMLSESVAMQELAELARSFVMR